MDFWDWIYQTRAQYAAAGDEERRQLTEYWYRAFQFGETDPDRAVALLREGCHRAEELGERWWTMMLTHYRLVALMFFKKDFRQVIEPAVANALAASRPENAAFPGRWLVYYDLTSAYLGVDPEGYAEPIRETLAFLDREIPTEPNESRYLMLSNLRQFHQEMGNFDMAEAVVTRYLELLHQGPDYHCGDYSMNFNYSSLCWIAYRRRDWSALSEHATLGDETARRTGQKRFLCEFLMWQAVLARRDGDEPRARRLHATAAATIANLRTPPGQPYPDAATLFHELGGDLDKALQVRDWELACVTSTGRFAYECEVHLKRAELLAIMRRLRTTDLDAARQTALKLRKPERPLSEIDKLTASVCEGR